jgi:hypothetical protein
MSLQYSYSLAGGKNMELESPDQILGKRIKTKLKENNLLEGTDIEPLIRTISTGKIKMEDWKLHIENSIERRCHDESFEEN